MLRIAPNPTADFHIGNLRVAIFNYILSVQRQEPLLVRIEDIDPQSSTPGNEKDIFEILSLFGIEYQQQQIQSNHIRFHRTMALQLLQDKKAFNCFCIPEMPNISNQYDGTCMNLTAEEVIDNENPFSIRLKKPSDPISVNDIIKGEITFEPDDVDSFILLDADKFPTYNFACAVDDMLSDISLVIRTEEHLCDTPKQMAVHKALGYDKNIEYAHLPALHNKEGKVISYGDQNYTVKWFLEEGYMPDAISNYLISLGNETPCEIFTLNEAIKWLDLKAISKEPVRFNLERLNYINREHLNAMDPKELSRYVGFADDEIGRLAKLYLREASTLKEIRLKIQGVFNPKNTSKHYADECKLLRDLTLKAPHFDDYDAYKSYLIEHSGLDDESIILPLRIMLTGAENGPELSDLYAHLKNYIKEVVK